MTLINDVIRIYSTKINPRPSKDHPLFGITEIDQLPRVRLEFPFSFGATELGSLTIVDMPGPDETNLSEILTVFNSRIIEKSAALIAVIPTDTFASELHYRNLKNLIGDIKV